MINNMISMISMIRKINHMNNNKKLVGITSLGERGQVVIPADIRDELNLKKGEKLFIFAKHKHFIGIVKFEEMSKHLKKWLSHIEGIK